MALNPSIRLMGDPCLLQKALPVLRFNSPELHELVARMHEILLAAGLDALAAPQIGVNVQVTVFGSAESEAREPEYFLPRTVLINPIITATSEDQTPQWEACSSLPGLSGEVHRPARVEYLGFDQYGNRFERTATQWHARIVQHEVDHLQGILFPSRIRDMRQFGFEQALLVLPSDQDDDDTAVSSEAEQVATLLSTPLVALPASASLSGGDDMDQSQLAFAAAAAATAMADVEVDSSVLPPLA